MEEAGKRNKKVNTLNALAVSLSRFMYVIAGIALACSMFLTVGDVILRTFKKPIVGTYELVGLLGALVIGFALPQTSRLKGHVIMDFVTDKLPARIQGILEVVSRILAIVLFGIIAWNMWGFGDDFRISGEVTPTLQLPTYPIAYSIAVCCAVECFVLFLDIFHKKDTES